MMFNQDFPLLVITAADHLSKSSVLAEISNVYSPTLAVEGVGTIGRSLVAEGTGYSGALKKAVESIILETSTPALERMINSSKMSVSPGIVTTLHKQIFQEYLRVNGLLPDTYRLPIININASLAELSQHGPTFFVNPHISSKQHTFIFSIFTKKYYNGIICLRVLNTFFGINYEIDYPTKDGSGKKGKKPNGQGLSLDSSISEILEVAVKYILPLIDADMKAVSAVKGISGFSLNTAEPGIIQKGAALESLQLFLRGLKGRLDRMKTETSTESETANVSTES